MKFKVYKSTEKKEIEELHFKLEETHSNSVRLLIVDKNGFNVPRAAILEISSKGVTMYSHINHKLGLSLDSERHVIVTFN